MIRLKLNDRYIRGTIVFEDNGDRAKFSYINTGLSSLPINARYELEGKQWRVAAVEVSDYNTFVTNVDLELINGR